MMVALGCGSDSASGPDGSAAGDQRVDGSASNDQRIDGSTSDLSGDGGTVSCEALTCGAHQYCFIECLCCGIAIPDGGPEPSSRAECVDIPQGCSATDICSCNGLLSGMCDKTSRTVHRLCA
jgi:hypothetical protein